MKTTDATIPAAFIRQDTRTNAADSFANVASLQRQRLNHNILAAQRVRKCLATVVYPEAGADGITVTCTMPITAKTATPIISQPLRFSPATREVVFVLRAKRISTGDVTLYAFIDSGSQAEDIDTSVTLTVNNASYARFAVTVPLSIKARLDGHGRLNVVGDGFMEGADLVSAAAITEIGSDFVEGAINADYTGKIVYFSDTGIGSRRIAHYIANVDAANNDRIYLSPPFAKAPTMAGTFGIRAAASINIQGYSIYEERVAAFFNETSTARA